jgi:hypothetical protein
LGSYGYTFVAKGTVKAFKAKLKHAGLVYQHLNEVQGQLVPVYLGNISLACPYFLDVGVRIVHMLLMSYAGEQGTEGFDRKHWIGYGLGDNLCSHKATVPWRESLSCRATLT